MFSSVKSKKRIEGLVLIKEVSKNGPESWLSLFVFIWPLPFLFFKRFVQKNKWRKRIANIFEALFLAFSIYFLFFVLFSFWAPTKWGYLAGIIICFYALIFLAEIFLPLIKYKYN
jgi:predicted permease